VDATQYETHIAGPVQGFVQGEHNVVTLVFQGGAQRTVPFLAPPRLSSDLVGRDELLRDLKPPLQAGASLALHGLPGVGKTALAVALAHDRDMLGQFYDGVLWARLGRQPNVLAQLGAWGAAMGLSGEEMITLSNNEDRAEAIHATIGLRRMLLIADDAWQAEAALLFKLGGPNCARLLTTRLAAVAWDFADDQPTEVHELSEANGLRLLERLAPEVVEAEPEAASTLVQTVGGLPLALTLLGRYLQKAAYSGQPRRVHTALERLRQAEVRLGVAQPQPPLASHPSLPRGASISLQAAIAISDAALDEASRRALQALAVFPPKPSTFSEEAALAVSAAPPNTLDTLTDFGLLETSGVGRYTLHQTITDYVRVQSTDPTADERLATYFVDYVKTHETEYDALDREMSNVLAAWQAAFNHGMSQALIQGANAFYAFMETRGLDAVAKVHLDRAEHAASTAGDAGDLVTTRLYLGEIAVHSGSYAQAETYFQGGLAQARELGHRERISALLLGLGTVAGSRGDYTRAEQFYQEGLALARELGDYKRISVLLQNLGAVAANRGDYTRAEQFYQEGLALARELGDYKRISDLLAHLGTVALRRGDYVQAEGCYQEGLSLAREMGHRATISFLLANLGTVALQRGEHVQAEMYLYEGLALARELGHRWFICGILSELGELHLTQQAWEAASAAFHEVQEMAQQTGGQEFVAGAAYGLARVAAAQDNTVEAHRQGRLSLAIFEAIGHSKVTEVRQWLAGLPSGNP